MTLATGILVISAAAVDSNSATAGSQDFLVELSPTQEYVRADARARVKFYLSSDRSELRYELTVERLDNFVQAHIHLTDDAVRQQTLFNRLKKARPKAEHGPIVAYLTDFMSRGVAADRMLIEGVIKEADLVGPLVGYPLDLLIEFMDGGNTYVAVHVLEPIPPNNTFCCPAGMRGTIQAGRSQ